MKRACRCLRYFIFCSPLLTPLFGYERCLIQVVAAEAHVFQPRLPVDRHAHSRRQRQSTASGRAQGGGPTDDGRGRDVNRAVRGDRSAAGAVGCRGDGAWVVGAGGSAGGAGRAAGPIAAGRIAEDAGEAEGVDSRIRKSAVGEGMRGGAAWQGTRTLHWGAGPSSELEMGKEKMKRRQERVLGRKGPETYQQTGSWCRLQ